MTCASFRAIGTRRSGYNRYLFMCQLLALNSNHPAAITFSFEGFVARGGLTDHHRDGWGIAFFEDTGCRLFVDYHASIDSPVAQLIKHYPIKSTNIIAHIRKATQGKISLPNCHPFMRELWGKYWVFAHNGDLKCFHPALTGQYLPVGFTDSEAAFCYILQCLRERHPYREPSANILFNSIQAIVSEIAVHGTFNFLLSNGDALFAHCSTNLHWVQRGYPFSTAQLVDCDMGIDFSLHNHPNDLITVIATQPLTSNEQWQKFESGELDMFVNGEIVRQYRPAAPPVPTTPSAEDSEESSEASAC